MRPNGPTEAFCEYGQHVLPICALVVEPAAGWGRQSWLAIVGATGAGTETEAGTPAAGAMDAAGTTVVETTGAETVGAADRP